MKAFHDSRDCAYRAPFGAVPMNSQVTLAIDVWDAPDATVQLRTWTDDEGETILDMKPTAEKTRTAPKRSAAKKTEHDGPATRFEVSFSPESAGFVWYHFIITTTAGDSYRLGVQAGHRGGASQVTQWEPPSYQLTVFDPMDLAPTWHRPIDGYLYDASAQHSLEETIQTLRENYPALLLGRTFGWDAGALLDGRDIKKLCAKPGMPTPGASGPMWRFAANDDVFGFWYQNKRGRLTCTLLNASLDQGYDVAIPLVDEVVSELLGGGPVPLHKAAKSDLAIPAPQSVTGGTKHARLHLGPLGAFVLYFHKARLLQKPMEPGVGVLAHITSLPIEVPYENACKMPVHTGEKPASENPTDKADASPSASTPADAANSAIAASGTLATASTASAPATQKTHPGTLGAPARAFVDWLAEAGVRYWQILPVNPTDEYGSPYAGISAFAGNTRLLEGTSAQIVDALGNAGSQTAYQEFCEREAAWLEPYASFMAIRRKIGPGAMWQTWPETYRTYDPDVIRADDELALYACIERRLQFVFDAQWHELRSYANERNVQIIGDMPIYVSADSADVWAHPELFQLDEDGAPRTIAGCPPDAFAADGQIWGNPVYDWTTLKATGYDWWLRRLKRAFDLYDMTRLDHFIGFSRYFAIPADGKAIDGTYRPGPGIELFQAAFDRLGPLPIVAEDLGIVTPGVRALSAACGFLGMDIIQFADGDPRKSYTPRPAKIAYTGTHDNQTLMGFCKTHYGEKAAAATADKLMKNVLTSSAEVCIVPLQDVLGLDDEARMNVPGVAEGNWTWQADAATVRDALPAARELVSFFR